MEFDKILEPYQVGDIGKTVTPESQIKWLKRLGFNDDVVTRTMIAVYTEVEQGKRTFKDWQEFNVCLKETAKVAYTKDLTAMKLRIQEFEKNLRKKWEQEQTWWQWMLGIKVKKAE